MNIQPNCMTTAMGIMPHRDIEKSLDLVLSLDVPFWPQLPNVSLYEDMYVQASQAFPGISVDTDQGTVRFTHECFQRALEDYFDKREDTESFALAEEYSVVYHQFLDRDLSRYAAIRGQITGPVSFGMKIQDEELKPIIYDDEVRAILFDIMQTKYNVQYRALKQKNTNAFVWVDEPGLGGVFSALVGYNDQQAKDDYRSFVEGLEGPKALHLCANVDLPYLLDLGLDILSFDAYQMEFMPREYAKSVADFTRRGGIIAWGIVPTDSASLRHQTPQNLANLLSEYWQAVAAPTGIEIAQLAAQALIAPARCCLRDIAEAEEAGEAACSGCECCSQLSNEEAVVETAFDYVKEVSSLLREEYCC